MRRPRERGDGVSEAPFPASATGPLIEPSAKPILYAAATHDLVCCARPERNIQEGSIQEAVFRESLPCKQSLLLGLSAYPCPRLPGQRLLHRPVNGRDTTANPRRRVCREGSSCAAVTSAVEGTEDVHGDTIPNYLDLDSDDDGVSDNLERTFGYDPYDGFELPQVPLSALPVQLVLGAVAVFALHRHRGVK